MGKRLGVSVQAAFVLFLVPTGIALFLLRKMPELNLAILSLVLFVPACASILFVALTAFFQSLLVGPKFTLAIAITFPLMHVALMLAIVRVAATTSQVLETLPPRMAPAVIWERWPILTVCAVLDFAVLSALAALGSRA